MKLLPNMAIAVLLVILSVPILTIFIKILVDDQNINKMAKALDSAETIFIAAAMRSGEDANIAANEPII